MQATDWRVTRATCSRLAVLAICVTFSLGSPVDAGNWPQFRGPDGNGISAEKGIPVSWSQGDYAWDVAIPGVGHAAPVIWDDYVFVTSAEDDGALRHLVCLSAETGKTRWSQVIGMNRSRKHQKSSWASATPATDGERVYVTFADKEQYQVAAYDFSGNLVWRRSLGPYESQHGLGVSPIVFEDRLIVANDQDGPSSLAAFDRKTGQVLWVTPRAFRDVSTSYSTPLVLREPNQPPQLIVVSAAMGITSHDPRNGELNWQTAEFPKRTVASPVFGGGLIIASCGQGGVYGVQQIAVDPKVRDENGKVAIKWSREKLIPYVPTPIVYGGYLFEWSDQGIVTCVDVKSGKDVWTQRLGGNYSSSPLCIDGKLYGIQENGQVTVLEAGPAFKELGTADLGDGSHATPAIANGRLYLRTFERLKCLSAKRS